MRVLVTGASGFLGREVVRAAAAAGHDVLALVRPTANTDAIGWGGDVTVLRGDLRQIGDWAKQLADVRAVAHLAAAPSGDLPTQFSGTVVATENLLQFLPMASLQRFVHVSSFSVYDYEAIGFLGTLSEATPIDPAPEKRDAYTITKIEQERLVSQSCAETGTQLVIIRPGAIVGPGKDWGFGRVIGLGRFDILFSPWSKFPLTYVSNCADAIVKALRADVKSGSIFNIVDDDLPSYRTYHRMCRRFANGRVGPAIYLPWLGVSLLGGAVSLVNRVTFRGRAKIPEFLDSRKQRVRWRPIFYSNRTAKEQLGWVPAIPLQEAVKRTVGNKCDH